MFAKRNISALGTLVLGFSLIFSSGCGVTDGISPGKAVETDPNYVIDIDKDGLGDEREINECFSDPDLVDTDSDGLSDYDECVTYHSNPTATDSDGDGIDDAAEVENGTDPTDGDHDDDGVSGLDDCDDEDPNRYPGNTDEFQNGGDLDCKIDVETCSLHFSENTGSGPPYGASTATITLSDFNVFDVEASGFGCSGTEGATEEFLCSSWDPTHANPVGYAVFAEEGGIYRMRVGRYITILECEPGGCSTRPRYQTAECIVGE